MSYKSEQQLMDVLQDVRERIIKIETKMEVLPELHEDVRRHEVELVKVRTERKTIKWLAGLLLISVPATVAAMVKIFRP